MSETRYMTQNDYSPTYEIEVDGNGEFVRLLHVWSFHPAHFKNGEAKEPPTDRAGPRHYEDYARKEWPAYRDRFKPKEPR